MADVQQFDRATALEAAQGGHAHVLHGSKDNARHFETQRHHAEATRGMRMDRQDGTGRGREEKRHGGGKGNWGLPADEGEGVTEEVGPDAGPDLITPADLVDDDKVMTLDEYESKKADSA